MTRKRVYSEQNIHNLMFIVASGMNIGADPFPLRVKSRNGVVMQSPKPTETVIPVGEQATLITAGAFELPITGVTTANLGAVVYLSSGVLSLTAGTGKSAYGTVWDVPENGKAVVIIANPVL